jgi:hypothetical protein
VLGAGTAAAGTALVTCETSPTAAVAALVTGAADGTAWVTPPTTGAVTACTDSVAA